MNTISYIKHLKSTNNLVCTLNKTVITASCNIRSFLCLFVIVLSSSANAGFFDKLKEISDDVDAISKDVENIGEAISIPLPKNNENKPDSVPKVVKTNPKMGNIESQKNQEPPEEGNTIDKPSKTFRNYTIWKSNYPELIEDLYSLSHKGKLLLSSDAVSATINNKLSNHVGKRKNTKGILVTEDTLVAIRNFRDAIPKLNKSKLKKWYRVTDNLNKQEKAESRFYNALVSLTWGLASKTMKIEKCAEYLYTEGDTSNAVRYAKNRSDFCGKPFASQKAPGKFGEKPSEFERRALFSKFIDSELDKYIDWVSSLPIDENFYFVRREPKPPYDFKLNGYVFSFHKRSFFKDLDNLYNLKETDGFYLFKTKKYGKRKGYLASLSESKTKEIESLGGGGLYIVTELKIVKSSTPIDDSKFVSHRSFYEYSVRVTPSKSEVYEGKSSEWGNFKSGERKYLFTLGSTKNKATSPHPLNDKPSKEVENVSKITSNVIDNVNYPDYIKVIGSPYPKELKSIVMPAYKGTIVFGDVRWSNHTKVSSLSEFGLSPDNAVNDRNLYWKLMSLQKMHKRFDKEKALKWYSDTLNRNHRVDSSNDTKFYFDYHNLMQSIFKLMLVDNLCHQYVPERVKGHLKATKGKGCIHVGSLPNPSDNAFEMRELYSRVIEDLLYKVISIANTIDFDQEYYVKYDMNLKYNFAKSSMVVNFSDFSGGFGAVGAYGSITKDYPVFEKNMTGNRGILIGEYAERADKIIQNARYNPPFSLIKFKPIEVKADKSKTRYQSILLDSEITVLTYDDSNVKYDSKSSRSLQITNDRKKADMLKNLTDDYMPEHIVDIYKIPTSTRLL